MKNLKRTMTVVMLFLFVPLAACGGGTTYGEEVTEKATITIADVLGKGEAADGNDAIVEGEVTSVCPSGCWFDIGDDSGNTLHILVGGDYAVPQTLSGKTVATKGYLQFNKGKSVIELVATGVTTK
ncbi:MAG: hypothetical protein GY771_12710 [bacterium]|nr:hypothetical protein [bacterium]